MNREADVRKEFQNWAIKENGTIAAAWFNEVAPTAVPFAIAHAKQEREALLARLRESVAASHPHFAGYIWKADVLDILDLADSRKAVDERIDREGDGK